MRIARIETPSGHRAWAMVDPAVRTVRRIVGGFSEWAPRTSAVTPPVLPESQSLTLDEVRLLAPIEPGGRIFGVVTNYGSGSSARGRKDRTPHPFAYIRPDSAIVHPDQEMRYPSIARRADFGVELVAVVACRPGDGPHAMACLLGYTIGNGITARAAAGDVGAVDLFTEKALDRTAALGPWITTLDEFGGPGQPRIDLTMRVNGEVRQFDNTENMLVAVDELLTFIDLRVALQPGDLVFTGTPAALGDAEGRPLQPGDQLASEIARIGVLRNVVGPRDLTDGRAMTVDASARTARRPRRSARP